MSTVERETIGEGGVERNVVREDDDPESSRFYLFIKLGLWERDRGLAGSHVSGCIYDVCVAMKHGPLVSGTVLQVVCKSGLLLCAEHR